ncbi:GTP-binding protein [Streptomyces griseorubiginosus]|uniref:Metal chaperone YciC n=1 Tax=Streptomyces griseorubiginosus TaxID=67304 RepID=A0AAI8L201_9ACTN|nr:GTP-binding protein [Streptomyces griseorubiginosus]AYC39563.1 Putative metal chaperone YciC [Streptomyces griseorubiginosus]KUM67355.1 cobalamin biosynthesis protein CobW [Streptomyces griseorubiginosus]
MLSVVIVGGLHADARKATVERLLADVPGSVVLHHDLATAAAGTVVRTIRDAGGLLSAGETPLVNDCACCALREDLVPELRRLDAAGTLRLAVVELWDSVEPKAMAEVVAAGGLTVTGVITAVDPALVLPYLGNGDDLADRGLAAAATDQRTVADTFARQLEYAPVLAVLDSPEADEEDRELLAQLHPTAHQIPIATGRPTTTDHPTRLTDPSVPDHATRLTDPTNSDHPTRLTDPTVPDHPARPTDPAHTDHATRPTDSTPTDHPVQPTDASGTLYPVRPTDASGTLYPVRPSPRSALVRAALAGFDVESAAAAQHPACARLPAEADAHGVSTLVWHRCRPFHPERLYEALEDITCAAARSRGRFWLADKPDVLLHWDAAGGALCVESVGPWLASLPDAAWDMVPPVRRAAAALDWHPEHGDCCQHLVFTSPGLDRDGLERLLESCLLTDAEYAAGRDAWKRLPPAFDTLLEV